MKALAAPLNRHRLRDNVVRELWDGPRLRYEVSEAGEVIATYWLSDDRPAVS